MMRNVIIGATLLALGVIVAGSLESARIASPDPSLLRGAARSIPSATSKSVGSMILGSGKEEQRRCI
jgi:hypothetical protein